MSARLITLISCDAPECDRAIEQDDRFTPPEWFYLAHMATLGDTDAHYCSVECLRRGVAEDRWEPTHD